VRRILLAVPLLFLLLLILPTGCAKQKAKPSGAAATHPEVEASQQCSDCHSEEAAAWQTSKHGQALVKCLVCHGAVESNFIPKPTAARCLACHGENVRHLNDSPPTKGKSCFDCHAPHALKAHSHMEGVQQ
jgi:hypothetical protein